MRRKCDEIPYRGAIIRDIGIGNKGGREKATEKIKLQRR